MRNDAVSLVGMEERYFWAVWTSHWPPPNLEGSWTRSQHEAAGLIPAVTGGGTRPSDEDIVKWLQSEEDY